MRRLLGVLFLVAGLVSVSVLAVRVGRGLFGGREPVSALDYLPPGRCVYVLVRGGGEHLRWVEVLRTRAWPLVGRLNREVYRLEYAAAHRLTEMDWRELVGEEVLVRFWPRFLLVARTKRSYNVFFNLRIRDDAEVRSGGVVYRTKPLPPDGRGVCYAFDRDWLVVADDVRELVRAIRRAGRRVFPVSRQVLEGTRVVFGWSGLPRRGGEELEALRATFGGRREGVVCGSSLASLRLYPEGDEGSVVSASGGWMFFRRVVEGREVGVVGVSAFVSDGEVSPVWAYLVPAGMRPEGLRGLVEVLRREAGRPELHLAQELVEGFHVVYDGGVLPVPERGGVYFRLDGRVLAREPGFDAEAVAFLEALGRVEVSQP